MNDVQLKILLFCLGVCSLQWLSSLPNMTVLALLGLLLLALYPWLKMLSLLMLGFIWAATYAISIENTQLPSILEGQDILVHGRVIDLPANEKTSTRFLFKVDTVIAPKNIENFPKIIKLNWYEKGKVLASSETWQFLVKLKQPHGLANPHGFDYEKWLFQQNIGATGYVRKSLQNKRLAPSDSWRIGGWREAVRRYLDKSNNEHIGVIKALVLGDRSGISAEQWQVFRKTGTSHLIAISGLHIGLVSTLMFGFVRRLTLAFPSIARHAIRFACIASFVSAFLYAALAGFSVPTQRALVMVSLVLGGVFWQRHYKPSQVIIIAILLVLLYDPLALMSPGFWLSFAAVGIILFALVGRLNKPTFIAQLVKTQWAVSIGLLPLGVYFFQQTSVASPLANIIAVPWVSFAAVPLLIIVMPLALINENVAIKGIEWVGDLLGFLWRYLQYLADSEYAYLSIPTVSIWACLAALIGGVIILLPKGFIPKPLACLLFLPLVFPMKASELGTAEFSATLLDVGQGLSVVIRTSNHTLIFDTGAKYSDKSDMGNTVILPYLKGEGVSRLDALVVSHGDNDHAGGAETLLSRIKTQRLLTSVPDLFVDDPTTDCEGALPWQWDGVRFEMLSLNRLGLLRGNNASCVLRVSSINGSILLTGDIERLAEKILLKYHAERLSSTVLIAPHHGSKSSSTEAFITAVSPQYVLFPVGYKNRFGFPKESIIDRYLKRKINVFDTSNEGAIHVLFKTAKPPSVSSFRQNNVMFWSWREENVSHVE